MLAMLWAAWVAKPTSVQGMMLSEIPPVITGARAQRVGSGFFKRSLLTKSINGTERRGGRGGV